MIYSISNILYILHMHIFFKDLVTKMWVPLQLSFFYFIHHLIIRARNII